MTLLNHQRNFTSDLKTKEGIFHSEVAKGSDYSLDHTAGTPLRTSMND